MLSDDEPNCACYCRKQKCFVSFTKTVLTDSDKFRIKLLEEKYEYALGRIRVETACKRNGITAAFSEKEVPAGKDRVAYETQCLQVSGIIIIALGAYALHFVNFVKGKPVKMLEKLDARYDLKTAS